MDVLEIMQSLKIADSKSLGEILLARNVYSTLQSARVNAQKKLNELVAQGALEKGAGYYRVIGNRSEFHDHSRFLTKLLAELYKLPDIEPRIFREHVIDEVGLRPDAICVLIKHNRGVCLILEAILNEPEKYLEMKRTTWTHWEGATDYLSKLFGYKIPHYEIVPITVLDEFISYLKEAV